MENRLVLVGNIGNNPVVTNFENGAKIARFNLAISEEKNGQKSVMWHKLFAWGNMAQFIEHFAQKGKRIVVSGKEVVRTYYSKDGEPQKSTEIEIREVIGI